MSIPMNPQRGRGYEIGLILVVLISLVSFLQIHWFQEQSLRNQGLSQIVAEAQQLEVRWREAEAQHLGFIASGEQAFADNYNRAARETQASSRALRQLVVIHTPYLQTPSKEVFVLLESRFKLMNETMKLRAQGAVSEARKRISSKKYSDLVIGIESGFRNLSHGLAQVEQQTSWLGTATPILFTILFGTGLAISLLIYHRRRTLREAEDYRNFSHTLSSQQSELERLNHELKDLSEAKTNFLAKMSHEIRTPMNAILGLARILGRTPLTAQQNKLVEGITSSTQALLAMINPVLDYSKIENQGVEIQLSEGVDLLQLMREVLNTQQGQAALKGLSLHLTAPKKNLHYLADPVRLRQVLLNLLGNAIKFTEKGSIELRLTTQEIDPESRSIRFEVIDTGIGIAPQSLGHLFQSFSQSDNSISRQYGGTGLGLSISKAIVEALGGQIGVQSQEGKGSTFWLTFPARISAVPSSIEKSPAAAAIAAPPASQAMRVENTANQRRKRDAPQLRILMIEDNPMNQFVLKNELGELGMTADAALSGFEGLKLLRQNRYDLVFLDLQMPGMDGFEVLTQLRSLDREFHHHSHVIATTAHSMFGYRERCLQAGMNDYLTKPIQESDLKRVLVDFQNLHTAQAATPANTSPAPQGSMQKSSINQKRWEKLMASSLGPEMITIFLETTPAKMRELQQAVHAHDAAQARDIAHFLKSSAASMAFDQWHEDLQNLEDHCDIGFKPILANQLFNKVEGEFEKLTTFLKKQSLAA